VTRATVPAVAWKGGRERGGRANEGENTPKNSAWNWAQVSSPQHWEAFDSLLHIAQRILPLLEKGSLLKRLAPQAGKQVMGLFGSVKNSAARRRARVRPLRWPDEGYAAARVRRLPMRLARSEPSGGGGRRRARSGFSGDQSVRETKLQAPLRDGSRAARRDQESTRQPGRGAGRGRASPISHSWEIQLPLGKWYTNR
jgi:hypothetical protein